MPAVNETARAKKLERAEELPCQKVRTISQRPKVVFARGHDKASVPGALKNVPDTTRIIPCAERTGISEAYKFRKGTSGWRCVAAACGLAAPTCRAERSRRSCRSVTPFPGCVRLDFDDEARGPSEESLAGIQNGVMETWHTRRRVTAAVACPFRHVPTRWAPALAARLGSGVPLMHPSEPEYWVASNRQRETNNFSAAIGQLREVGWCLGLNSRIKLKHYPESMDFRAIVSTRRIINLRMSLSEIFTNASAIRNACRSNAALGEAKDLCSASLDPTKNSETGT